MSLLQERSERPQGATEARTIGTDPFGQRDEPHTRHVAVPITPPTIAVVSHRRAMQAFLWASLLRGRPRVADGILVYDALQVAPYLAWSRAGYLNFGLWDPGIASGDQACEHLLAHVADCGDLATAGDILDVGFGTGAQDLFFAGLTDAAITGVNSSASQTALARGRVEAASIGGRVDLRRGDATRLDMPDGSFDAVVCIEAAFHFDPRERFFREAHRVLRPGGRLIVVDILSPAEPHWTDAIFWTTFDRLFFVPRTNRISPTTYHTQLEACGFAVRLERLTERVYVPFFAACARAYEWWAARAVASGLERWFRRRSPCEYVLAVATK